MTGERVSLTAVVVAVDWLTATHGVLNHVFFERYTGPTGSLDCTWGHTKFICFIMCSPAIYFHPLDTVLDRALQGYRLPIKFDGRLEDTQRGLANCPRRAIFERGFSRQKCRHRSIVDCREARAFHA
jgi:hypothetical protein